MSRQARKLLNNKLAPLWGRRASSQERHMKTAGIIVIGDEILKGDVVDTNSGYMASKLHRVGVDLRKISIIGDCVEEIGREVGGFSGRFDYVITTGGIGPTHDDVTFEAVAKAFGEELHPHPELVKICSKFYKTTDMDSPGMKLCWVPKSAKLIYGEDRERGLRTKYPNVSVRNVFMFPGIPQLLEGSFDLLCPKLFQSGGGRYFGKCVYLNIPECQVIEALDELVKEFPEVMFGSYPKLYNTSYKVKITIESTDEQQTLAAYRKLLENVPEKSVVKCPEDDNYKLFDK